MAVAVWLPCVCWRTQAGSSAQLRRSAVTSTRRACGLLLALSMCCVTCMACWGHCCCCCTALQPHHACHSFLDFDFPLRSGGGFGGNSRVFRSHFGGFPAQRAQAAQQQRPPSREEQQRGAMLGLMQVSQLCLLSYIIFLYIICCAGHGRGGGLVGFSAEQLSAHVASYSWMLLHSTGWHAALTAGTCVL